MEVIRYGIGDYMVVDSKVLNIFADELEVELNGYLFCFIFKKTREKTFSMRVGRTAQGRGKLYNIYVNNFEKESLQGFFDPIELATIEGIKYFFTISGFAFSESGCRTFVINILREIQDVEKKEY